MSCEKIPHCVSCVVSEVTLNLSNEEMSLQTLSTTKPTESMPEFETVEEPEHHEEIVPIEKVTVKFQIHPNHVIAQVYPNCMTLAEVKIDIARRFEVPPELLILKEGNITLSDECCIRETPKDEYGIHEYVLELMEPPLKDKSEDYDEAATEKPKLDLNVYNSKHRLPDFIEVHIAAEDSRIGKERNLIVEIQNKAIVKPFLCGYLDRSTGVEYLDAFTQTGPFINKCKFQTYACRDSQTFEHKVKNIDTTHEHSTQCWLDGNNVRFFSQATDYFITPGEYVTYAQQEKLINRLGKIRLIQRNFRRYKWMQWMKACAAEYRRLVANRLADEKAFHDSEERRIRREQRAKQFPRTRDDFDLLYGEVHKWKQAEITRITRMYDGAARVSEINILLDKEIKLLNGIERQRMVVNESMKEFREEQMLKKLGEPIKWVGYGDTIVHLDLIRNQRARFLTEVYKDLEKPLPIEERLQLITKVREILLGEQDFPEFSGLFDLFDRERNLLVYAKNCDVEILRKRQMVLFMELIKFEREPQAHRKDNRMCLVCQKIKPYAEFALRTRQNQVDTCKKCYYLKVASTEIVVYNAILRSVQREERKKRCSNSFAFIMQVDDIRYIIDQIWHGHSILSKCENLSKLRLPRWLKSEEWSPWNCICLTDSETRNHLHVEDLESVYDEKTRLEICNRHWLAKQAFRNMTAVSVEFTETGQWYNIGMNLQRTIRLKDITSQKGLAKTKADSTTDNELSYKMGKIL